MKSLSLGRGVPLTGILEGVPAIKCEFDAVLMQVNEKSTKQNGLLREKSRPSGAVPPQDCQADIHDQRDDWLSQPDVTWLIFFESDLEAPAQTAGHDMIGIVGA